MNRAVVPVPVLRKQFEQGVDGCVEITGNGVADRIIAEPLGGAHRDAGAAIDAVGREIGKMLDELGGMDGQAVRADRRRKYLDLGSKGLAA